MYQSKIAGHPLTSDEGKCLLYIAICGFLILCPIDASIFISNLNKLKDINKDIPKSRPPADEEDL